jgi:hypothetical protein
VKPGAKIFITPCGKPTGVLSDLGLVEDWLDYQLENNPGFLRRMDQRQKSLLRRGLMMIE